MPWLTDPSITAQMPQAPNPLDAYMRFAQLKQLGQEQEYNKLRLSHIAQQDERDKALLPYEVGKAQNEDRKAKLEAGLQRMDVISRIAASVKDEAGWHQGMDMAVQLGIPEAEQLRTQPYDPARVQQIAQSSTAAKDQMAQALAQMDFERKAAEDKQKAADAEAGRKTTERGQDISAATAKRGQDVTRAGQIMTNSRMRDANEISRNTKKEAKAAADQGQLTDFESDMDRLSVAAHEVLEHPGLAGVTGLKGTIWNRPGGDAADAEAKLRTLKSQIGFGVLQKMRNASKTGGAVGSLSDKELIELQNNLAALDTKQSHGQMAASLRKIIEFSDQAKGRAESSYKAKYGGGDSPSTPPAGGKPIWREVQ